MTPAGAGNASLDFQGTDSLTNFVKTVIVSLSKNEGMRFCGLATALTSYTEWRATNVGCIDVPINKI